MTYRDDLSLEGIGWTPPTLGEWREAQAADVPTVAQERPERVFQPEPLRERQDDAWRESAACLNHPNPRLWVDPINCDGGIEAERICHDECPVRAQCLAWKRKHLTILEATGLVIGGYLWTAKGKTTQRLPFRPCDQCGTSFRPRDRLARFCSERCSNANSNEVRRAGRVNYPTCQWCGARIEQNKVGARRKWCSMSCANKANYRVRRKRGAA